MRTFPEKYRILVWISLSLFAGFLLTGISAYELSKNAAEHALTEQVMPLTGEAIHAEIHAELVRPTLLASTMATDSFVRDWLLEGETESEPIIRYLAEVRQKHGARNAFLVSDRTRKHYGADGLRNPIQDNVAQDGWYFRAKEAKAPFVIELGTDSGNRGAATIFVTQRMLDKDGNFLGVAGVALAADRLGRAIDSIRQRFGARIYLVDAQRKILAFGASPSQEAIDALPGIGRFARELLHGGSKPVALQYQRDGNTVHVSSRFVPETGWHLLVEQDAAAGTKSAQQLLLVILALGAGVTALVLILMLLTVNRYHEKLEQMAGSDPVTGLLNRRAFDIVFKQAMLEADRNGRPLSGILFDVDYFRQVNELHGYAAGDEVLRTVSRIARAMLRESDVLTRCNGEEFFVLLKECSLEQAVTVAEKVRQEIDQHDFSPAVPDGHITISLGVAQHLIAETASAFFTRADEALYKAKVNGRNRLHVARAEGVAGTETSAA